MSFLGVQRTWSEPVERNIDRGALAGMAVCALLVIVGILTSGAATHYLDVGGFLLVIGGTVGATLIHYSLTDIRRGIGEFSSIMFETANNPYERIHKIVSLAQAVREQGMLVLESEAEKSGDHFLRLALETTVDGQTPEDIKRTLETEASTSTERGVRAAQMFQTMGGYSPAMGLIGTLIGLIQMLNSLNDPSSVGPAMSLALVATLYGAVVANLFCLPIAGKIRNRTEEELLIKKLTIEGILGIGRQESPIVLEQRLRSYIPNTFQ